MVKHNSLSCSLSLVAQEVVRIEKSSSLILTAAFLPNGTLLSLSLSSSFNNNRLWNIAESWSGSISSRQGLNDTIRDIASRVKVYTELTCDQLEKRYHNS